MSVLIKGLEMPKSCGECFACKAELSQEKKVIYVCCFTREEYVSDENRVETDCPLTPVPPHGRLGDLDALAAQCDDPYWCVWLSDIDAAPTVIEAEDGE